MDAPLDGWIEFFREVARQQRRMLTSMTTGRERSVVIGRGAGGDPTLDIDRRLEKILVDSLGDAPEAVAVISEEAGSIGDADTTLLVDPLDGSFNAQRLFPAYAFSVALARGLRVGDVELAYVFDLATGDEFVAKRGQGGSLNGEPISAQRRQDGLAVVAFESVEYDPSLLAAVIEATVRQVGSFRARVVGSTALALCYAAVGRVDAVVSSGECRVIDFAAAQLVAREAGLAVACQDKDLDSIDFGLEREHRINAAPTEDQLRSIAAALEKAMGAPDS
jgi:myo-inositol-1(or 4)-monophosphatase